MMSGSRSAVMDASGFDLTQAGIIYSYKVIYYVSQSSNTVIWGHS